MTLTFDHGISRIRDFGIHAKRDEKTGKIEIQTIEVAGEQVVPSKRFWKSFFQRFGVSESIFPAIPAGDVRFPKLLRNVQKSGHSVKIEAETTRTSMCT